MPKVGACSQQAARAAGALGALQPVQAVRMDVTLQTRHKSELALVAP